MRKWVKKFKENMSKESRAVKYGFALLCVVLFSGLTLGAWVLSYTPSSASGFQIDSDSVVSFSDNFSMENINTNNGSVYKMEEISMDNVDGNRTLVVGINTTITDVADACDNSGDVAVVVSYEGTPITNGENITVAHGESSVTVETAVGDLACPQTVQSELTLDSV